MSNRFFLSSPIASELVTLDGPEAHHLLHVGRAMVGQEITLFDGSGAEFPAVVDRLGRTSVDCRIIGRMEIDRELPQTLVVGVALPKGDRQKWLTEKLTELGVTTLVPLITDRGVAQPTAAALDRLRRSVVEASKQCGRNRLMEISGPRKLSDWISQPPDDNPHSPAIRRLIAHPQGMPLHELDLTARLPTRVALGPEGGFSEAEMAASGDAGWQVVSLGPRILRIETAAVALAAALALR